jgi:hypothetical protein
MAAKETSYLMAWGKMDAAWSLMHISIESATARPVIHTLTALPMPACLFSKYVLNMLEVN